MTSSELSPMMRQYWDIKSQYPDALLFFRLGDFYELFEADAQVAARELDITLTGRPEPSSPTGRVPMAGVPFRAAELYLARLIAKGYSVAICEQVGQVGQGKGPVERKVTRVLTPGTVLESNLLPNKENNYLVALNRSGDTWGLACVDASCGEFLVTQVNEQQLSQELARLSPREVLVAKRMGKKTPDQVIPEEILDIPAGLEGQYRFSGRPSMYFQLEPAQRRIMQVFAVTTLDGFGCQSMPGAIGAAGAVLEYLEHTQAGQMPKFAGISTYNVNGYLVLDANTRRNLELTETVRDRNFEGSLLWAIDKTRTAMGSRMLRKWLLAPLFSIPQILERQKAVAELVANFDLRQQLGNCLTGLSDLERLAVKLTSETICPKDLVAIQQSLESIPNLASIVANCSSSHLTCLGQIPENLIRLNNELARVISPEAPRELTEGGIFNLGYCAEVDEVRSLLGGGKQWIENFQKQERERTGVSSLKVSFNSTFGYYIEITHANKDAVPAEYIRKQTLTNAERFITPELKEYEAKILNAEKNQGDIEYKLFLEFRQTIAGCGVELTQLAQQLASIDALLSLADSASQYKYVAPVVDDSTKLEINNGRHPVLERLLPMGKFVPNDTRLYGSSDDHQLIILTGPNMSGKSSLLRQVAHIVLLAQIGSFVPADSAHVGLVDRIFTRIGAVDDLTQGQSTFLVEMSETTQCCLSATDRSLILLDEVGRGTSTYDGVSIAWSVAEFLATQVKARTVFATHYHEMNALSNYYAQITNYQVMVREYEGHVEFMRRLAPGGASRSYGIHVARMAGLPPSIIDRAQFLMSQMERKSGAAKLLDSKNIPQSRDVSALEEAMQLSLFAPS